MQPTGDVSGLVSAAEESSPQRAAQTLSAQCLFNALLRETQGWSWAALPPALGERERGGSPGGVAARIPLDGGRASLWLPLRYRSTCGRHRFGLPVLLQGPGGPETLDLVQALEAIAGRGDLLPAVSDVQKRRFVHRVAASVANIGTALRHRGDIEALFAPASDFIAAEQALVVGHAVHPAPRSRDPMTDADARVYAPEFGGRFGLRWLAVEPGRLAAEAAPGLSPTNMLARLYAAERGRTPALPAPAAGEVPVPAHPWQWRQLLEREEVGSLVRQGRLRELGESAPEWRATSSLRAVHAEHAPWMLKFSVSVRLTNSLRTLQPAEMVRGLQVHAVQQTPVWHEFQARYPRFRVLAEPAFVTLQDLAGARLGDSLVLFRDNPFRDAADCSVLATLTQDHPGAGDTAVVRRIRRLAGRGGSVAAAAAAAATRWFDAFLDAVVEPLLVAQADYGLLFGAHQQNLVLGFADGIPVRGYFRDCQGTGFSSVAVELLEPYIPRLGERSENILDSGMANRLFAYYLIVNTCFGVIAAIAAGGVAAETDLLGRLRKRLEALRVGPRRDRSCLDYVLDAPELWAKGNFICAWHGYNETTLADPASIYHPLTNPLLDRPEESDGFREHR